MRTFELHRDTDETGISGTGRIAEGAVFEDGTCVLRWVTAQRSAGVYESLASLLAIHGHGGKTRVVYTGDAYERGRHDCIQDGYENCPFASVGGLDGRATLSAPDYVAKCDHDSYLRGYADAAEQAYGKDWRTCGFGWRPAFAVTPGV
jgi:hypothetical protein